jgi:putative endopeptidase
MKFRNLIAALIVCALTVTGLADDSTKEPVSGIDMTAVDQQVRPQDDFFRFVNGTWLEKTEIPADKSRYSMFSVLSDQAQEQLKVIILDASKASPLEGSNQQKLGDMYNSFMDEEAIEKLGSQPISTDLTRISALENHTDVAGKLGELFKLGVSGPLGFYVYPDAKDPGTYGFWLFQSGLTLPDRDYYLKDEEKYQKFRADMETYVGRLLTAAGYENPAQAAKNVVALETTMAQKHISRVDARDAEKNYNKRSAEQLKSVLKGFDWEAFAKSAGAADVDQIIVRNYPYFEAMGELFDSTDVQAWKDYMAFHLVDSNAHLLSKEFVDLHFGFHSTTLNGVPENEPRWKRGVSVTSGALGEVLGQEYVARHFTPEAKAKMEKLVQNLTKAYGQSISELEWMSDETKEKALVKLASFKPKVGYPDKWRDYSDLEIKGDDLMGNSRRSAKFELDYDLNRVGKAVDPVDWGMTPQTVNAYYSPTRNEIVFPAAILQPPFFNMAADDAVNYGGIGGVIGHEIGHGFDDQGSKYDGGGNLRSWWTEEDRTAFDALGDRFVAQYDKFSPLEGMNVNGRLTLGENIGDLAGVTIGYRAYLMSLDGREAPVIDGLTGEQRFFMGWAQVWRSKMREDALRARLLSDPHSPAPYRVLGPLRNVDAFYQAFDVKETDEMYLAPEERVKIW